MNFHRKWCKDTVIAIIKGEAIKPYRVFLSGPGGVGKSYVISLVHRDTVKLLLLSRQVEPEDVSVTNSSFRSCSFQYSRNDSGFCTTTWHIQIYHPTSYPRQTQYPYQSCLICNCLSLMKSLWWDPICYCKFTNNSSS